MTQKVALKCENLSIGYKCVSEHKTLFKDLDLEIYKGELLCLLGPNGIGKSTLIKTILGIQPSLKGSIKVNDQDITSYTSRELALEIGAMITEKVDVDYLNVYDLVAIGRYPHTHWLQGLEEKDHQQIKTALRAMEIEHFSTRLFSTLSDGEKQRALIARALAQDTQILLLDEPTSYLDISHKVESLRLLRNWAHQNEKAILLSTHDLELVMGLADRVWLMDQQQKIHIGAPEDLMLDQSFSSCFNAEHIRVNPDNGHLELLQQGTASVDIQGPQQVKNWTERAFTRAGFKIKSTQADYQIDIELTNDQVNWVLREVQPKRFTNIYSCVRHLQYAEKLKR